MPNGNGNGNAAAVNRLQGAALTPGFGPSQQPQAAIITLAPDETRQVIIQGQWFYIKEAYLTADASSSNDVEVSSDICGPTPHNVGTGLRFASGSQFQYITVHNPATNGEVYLEIIAGYGEFIDNRLNIVRTRPASLQPVVDAQSEAEGSGVTSIAAAGTEVFPATPPAGYLFRKSITISNLDPSAPLYVRDAVGAVIGVVFAQTAQVYFVSGEVQVFNPNAGAVACFIGEIWYLPQQP